MKLLEMLKEYAGLDEKEAPEWFVITESETETVLKPIRHLDGPTFNAVYRMAVDHEGTYDNTPGARCFHIPKPKESVAPSNQKLETALGHVPEATEDYALRKSLKGKLGQLVPCLEDAEGIMFDGLHRKRLDPKAWTVKIDRIKTPVDRAQARMTVNFCRRHYTPEEMKDDIGLLVGSGLSVEQIAESTGISERTVYRYMPESLKKPEAKAISEGMKEKVKEEQLTAVSSFPKTQDTPQFVASAQGYIATELRSCEKCGQPVHRSKMGIVAGKLVCPKCAGIAEPKATVGQPSKPFKPKETGDFRVGQMHPQKSKFELAVIQELQSEGLPLETDQDICAVKTRPDAILRLQNSYIAIYIDNEITHPEGNGRDEFLRDKIEAQGWKVLRVRWKNDSQEERQRAKETVKEFLKW